MTKKNTISWYDYSASGKTNLTEVSEIFMGWRHI